jgi:hypothetical protein
MLPGRNGRMKGGNMKRGTETAKGNKNKPTKGTKQPKTVSEWQSKVVRTQNFGGVPRISRTRAFPVAGRNLIVTVEGSSLENISPRATNVGAVKVHSIADILAAGGPAAYAKKIGHTPATPKVAGKFKMTDDEVRLAREILNRD